MIRLGVVLLLVIVVMREARRPGLYQTFFDAPEATSFPIEPPTKRPTSPAQSGNVPDNTAASETDAATSAAPPPVAIGWNSAPQWIDAMELPLQRAWVQSLVQLQSASDRKPLAWVGLSVAQLDASAALLVQSSPAQDRQANEEVLAAIERLRGCATAGECPPGLWNQILPWAAPTLDALEAAAYLRVSDGTFWTSDDSDAFYLGLARSSQLAADDGVTTGTLPLLQQPEIYRGQVVRLVGTLQLAHKKTAQANRVGITSYWKLWIIPADGGIRPTILMTQELPRILADSLTADGKWNRQSSPANPDGQIAAVGRFIKRLPYRSSIGADLAPVVIGRVVAAKGAAALAMPDSPAESQAATQPNASAPNASADNPAGIIGIVFAIFGGIALAGWLMYRSAVDAKRTRKLRKHAGERIELDLNQPSDGDPPKQGT